MNLTFAVDERVVEKARAAAQSMGKSLNQLVREYLEQLAGHEAVESELAELRALSMSANGRSQGWRFDRDSLHERP